VGGLGRQRYLWASLVILLPFAAVSLWLGMDRGLPVMSDFQWSPSRLLLQHKDPYALFLSYVHGELAVPPYFLKQRPNYPAFGLLLLWPFAMLPWHAAKAAWLLASLGSALGTVWLLVRANFARSNRALAFLVLSALLFASTSFRVTIHLGQHGLAALFLFFCAVALAESGRRRGAALFLAGSWLKYSITGPLALYFLARGKVRVLALAALLDGALVLAAAAWTGRNPMALAVEPLLVNRSGGIDAPGYINLSQLLLPYGEAGFAAAVVLALTLIGLAACLVRFRPSPDPLLTLSLLALLAAVVAFHEIYDMVILVVPATYALRAWCERDGRSNAPLALLFALLVAAVWFGERLVDELPLRHFGAIHLAASAAMAWLVPILAYGSILAVFVLGFRRVRAPAA